MITITFDDKRQVKLQVNNQSLAALSPLEKTNLEVELRELAHSLHGMVDSQSAEEAIRREVARRMSNLAGEAMAAGKLADIWDDQNSRFYKQRRSIEREHGIEVPSR